MEIENNDEYHHNGLINNFVPQFQPQFQTQLQQLPYQFNNTNNTWQQPQNPTVPFEQQYYQPQAQQNQQPQQNYQNFVPQYQQMEQEYYQPTTGKRTRNDNTYGNYEEQSQLQSEQYLPNTLPKMSPEYHKRSGEMLYQEEQKRTRQPVEFINELGGILPQKPQEMIMAFPEPRKFSPGKRPEQFQPTDYTRDFSRQKYTEVPRVGDLMDQMNQYRFQMQNKFKQQQSLQWSNTMGCVNINEEGFPVDPFTNQDLRFSEKIFPMQAQNGATFCFDLINLAKMFLTHTRQTQMDVALMQPNQVYFSFQVTQNQQVWDIPVYVATYNSVVEQYKQLIGMNA